MRGPIAQAQIVETALLNMINFETLIATKASRVVSAAQGDAVVDFGLRRAQGNDGAISDTYNTLQGVANAIEVAKKLRARGHEFAGIRLDSGDLAYLSIEARKMPDAAGFADAVIAASNDLDEHLILSLKNIASNSPSR